MSGPTQRGGNERRSHGMVRSRAERERAELRRAALALRQAGKPTRHEDLPAHQHIMQLLSDTHELQALKRQGGSWTEHVFPARAVASVVPAATSMTSTASSRSTAVSLSEPDARELDMREN